MTKRKNGTVENEQRLIWIDCEMTGLDLELNRLVEIACIVSEPDLSMVAEFGPLAIRQPPEVMENMNDWCKETFKHNGLLERIKVAEDGEAEVERKVRSARCIFNNY